MMHLEEEAPCVSCGLRLVNDVYVEKILSMEKHVFNLTFPRARSHAPSRMDAFEASRELLEVSVMKSIYRNLCKAGTWYKSLFKVKWSDNVLHEARPATETSTCTFARCARRTRATI